MKRDDLKAKGLTDEQIDFVMGEYGRDVESHKAKLTTAQAELDSVKTQLTEASTTIDGFKALNVDQIKAAADEWKAKAEQAAKDAAAQISSLKFDHALDGALTGAKARNAKAVKALLDSNALKLNDDGSILGLNEQLAKIKSENDYLFDGEAADPKIVAGGNSKSVISDPMMIAVRKAAGLSVE